MSTAIITGASSGLGKEYLASVIREYPDIDEFWLIARRKDKLLELAKDFPEKTIIPMPLDLTKKESMSVLKKILEERQPLIEVLVNNSGYGKLGEFSSMEIESQLGMIDLNIRALTELSYLVLEYMVDGGIIINVSSIASFVPTANMSVYSSTKAYVTSFSKALRLELKPRDINVIAVCPGPMDTEFNAVAGVTGKSPRFEGLPKDSVENIADGSLLAAIDGKSVYTGKFFFKLYRFLSKILPDSLLMKFTKL